MAQGRRKECSESFLLAHAASKWEEELFPLLTPFSSRKLTRWTGRTDQPGSVLICKKNATKREVLLPYKWKELCSLRNKIRFETNWRPGWQMQIPSGKWQGTGWWEKGWIKLSRPKRIIFKWMERLHILCQWQRLIYLCDQIGIYRYWWKKHKELRSDLTWIVHTAFIQCLYNFHPFTI